MDTYYYEIPLCSCPLECAAIAGSALEAPLQNAAQVSAVVSTCLYYIAGGESVFTQVGEDQSTSLAAREPVDQLSDSGPESVAQWTVLLRLVFAQCIQHTQLLQELLDVVYSEAIVQGGLGVLLLQQISAAATASAKLGPGSQRHGHASDLGVQELLQGQPLPPSPADILVVACLHGSSYAAQHAAVDAVLACMQAHSVWDLRCMLLSFLADYPAVEDWLRTVISKGWLSGRFKAAPAMVPAAGEGDEHAACGLRLVCAFLWCDRERARSMLGAVLDHLQGHPDAFAGEYGSRGHSFAAGEEGDGSTRPAWRVLSQLAEDVHVVLETQQQLEAAMTKLQQLQARALAASQELNQHQRCQEQWCQQQPQEQRPQLEAGWYSGALYGPSPPGSLALASGSPCRSSTAACRDPRLLHQAAQQLRQQAHQEHSTAAAPVILRSGASSGAIHPARPAAGCGGSSGACTLFRRVSDALQAQYASMEELRAAQAASEAAAAAAAEAEAEVFRLMQVLGGEARMMHVLPHAQQLLERLQGNVPLLLAMPPATVARTLHLLAPLLALHEPLLSAMVSEAAEAVKGATATAAASRRAARLKLLRAAANPSTPAQLNTCATPTACRGNRPNTTPGGGDGSWLAVHSSPVGHSTQATPSCTSTPSSICASLLRAGPWAAPESALAWSIGILDGDGDGEASTGSRGGRGEMVTSDDLQVACEVLCTVVRSCSSLSARPAAELSALLDGLLASGEHTMVLVRLRAALEQTSSDTSRGCGHTPPADPAPWPPHQQQLHCQQQPGSASTVDEVGSEVPLRPLLMAKLHATLLVWLLGSPGSPAFNLHPDGGMEQDQGLMPSLANCVLPPSGTAAGGGGGRGRATPAADATPSSKGATPSSSRKPFMRREGRAGWEVLPAGLLLSCMAAGLDVAGSSSSASPRRCAAGDDAGDPWVAPAVEDHPAHLALTASLLLEAAFGPPAPAANAGDANVNGEVLATASLHAAPGVAAGACAEAACIGPQQLLLAQLRMQVLSACMEVLVHRPVLGVRVLLHAAQQQLTASGAAIPGTFTPAQAAFAGALARVCSVVEPCESVAGSGPSLTGMACDLAAGAQDTALALLACHAELQAQADALEEHALQQQDPQLPPAQPLGEPGRGTPGRSTTGGASAGMAPAPPTAAPQAAMQPPPQQAPPESAARCGFYVRRTPSTAPPPGTRTPGSEAPTTRDNGTRPVGDGGATPGATPRANSCTPHAYAATPAARPPPLPSVQTWVASLGCCCRVIEQLLASGGMHPQPGAGCEEHLPAAAGATNGGPAGPSTGPAMPQQQLLAHALTVAHQSLRDYAADGGAQVHGQCEAASAGNALQEAVAAAAAVYHASVEALHSALREASAVGDSSCTGEASGAQPPASARHGHGTPAAASGCAAEARGAAPAADEAAAVNAAAAAAATNPAKPPKHTAGEKLARELGSMLVGSGEGSRHGRRASAERSKSANAGPSTGRHNGGKPKPSCQPNSAPGEPGHEPVAAAALPGVGTRTDNAPADAGQVVEGAPAGQCTNQPDTAATDQAVAQTAAAAAETAAGVRASAAALCAAAALELLTVALQRPLAADADAVRASGGDGSGRPANSARAHNPGKLFAAASPPCASILPHDATSAAEGRSVAVSGPGSTRASHARLAATAPPPHHQQQPLHDFVACCLSPHDGARLDALYDVWRLACPGLGFSAWTACKRLAARQPALVVGVCLLADAMVLMAGRPGLTLGQLQQQQGSRQQQQQLVGELLAASCGALAGRMVDLVQALVTRGSSAAEQCGGAAAGHDYLLDAVVELTQRQLSGSLGPMPILQANRQRLVTRLVGMAFRCAPPHHPLVNWMAMGAAGAALEAAGWRRVCPFAMRAWLPQPCLMRGWDERARSALLQVLASSMHPGIAEEAAACGERDEAPRQPTQVVVAAIATSLSCCAWLVQHAGDPVTAAAAAGGGANGTPAAGGGATFGTGGSGGAPCAPALRLQESTCRNIAKLLICIVKCAEDSADALLQLASGTPPGKGAGTGTTPRGTADRGSLPGAGAACQGGGSSSPHTGAAAAAAPPEAGHQGDKARSGSKGAKAAGSGRACTLARSLEDGLTPCCLLVALLRYHAPDVDAWLAQLGASGSPKLGRYGRTLFRAFSRWQAKAVHLLDKVGAVAAAGSAAAAPADPGVPHAACPPPTAPTAEAGAIAGLMRRATARVFIRHGRPDVDPDSSSEQRFQHASGAAGRSPVQRSPRPGGGGAAGSPAAARAGRAVAAAAAAEEEEEIPDEPLSLFGFGGFLDDCEAPLRCGSGYGGDDGGRAAGRGQGRGQGIGGGAGSAGTDTASYIFSPPPAPSPAPAPPHQQAATHQERIAPPAAATRPTHMSLPPPELRTEPQLQPPVLQQRQATVSGRNTGALPLAPAAAAQVVPAAAGAERTGATRPRIQPIPIQPQDRTLPSAPAELPDVRVPPPPLRQQPLHQHVQQHLSLAAAAAAAGMAAAKAAATAAQSTALAHRRPPLSQLGTTASGGSQRATASSMPSSAFATGRREETWAGAGAATSAQQPAAAVPVRRQPALKPGSDPAQRPGSRPERGGTEAPAASLGGGPAPARGRAAPGAVHASPPGSPTHTGPGRKRPPGPANRQKKRGAAQRKRPRNAYLAACLDETAGRESGSDSGGWSDLEDFVVCQPDRDYHELLEQRFKYNPDAVASP